MHKIDRIYLLYSSNVDLVSNDILCISLILEQLQSMHHLVEMIHQFFLIVQLVVYEMDPLVDLLLFSFY